MQDFDAAFVELRGEIQDLNIVLRTVAFIDLGFRGEPILNFVTRLESAALRAEIGNFRNQCVSRFQSRAGFARGRFARARFDEPQRVEAGWAVS